MRSPKPWSPAEDALLRSLANEGKSSAAIAAQIKNQLGIERSRNSVIGRANRSNVVLRSTPLDGAHRTNNVVKKTERKVAPKPSKPLPVTKDNIVLDETKFVGVHDLRSTTCRFPVKQLEGNAWLFCGQTPAAGKVYCADHAKICYYERKKK